MEEWKKVRLGDCIQEINEKTTENNQYEVLTSSKSGIYSQEEYFDKQVASKDNTGYKIIKKGQFTYRSMSDNGTFTINRLENKEIGIVSPAYPVFEVTNINGEYLKCFFSSELFSKAIHTLSQGSTRTALKYKDLSDIELLLPPMEEQKKIVKIIEKTDKIINNYERLLEEKDLFIRTQFVEIFGNPLSSNKYGRITLDKITKVRQGLQIPISERKDKPAENRYKYITIQYLHNNKAIEYIENPNPNVICKKDDILMTRTGNTGQVVTNVEGVFHNNFFIVDYDKNKINKLFFIEYFKNKDVYRDMIIRATSTSILDLSHGEFYKMSIDLPPMELQNKFARIVEKINEQKLNLEKIIESYKILRKGLMQKLLTGKVRVKI